MCGGGGGGGGGGKGGILFHIIEFLDVTFLPRADSGEADRSAGGFGFKADGKKENFNRFEQFGNSLPRPNCSHYDSQRRLSCLLTSLKSECSASSLRSVWTPGGSAEANCLCEEDMTHFSQSSSLLPLPAAAVLPLHDFRHIAPHSHSLRSSCRTNIPRPRGGGRENDGEERKKVEWSS